MYRKEKKTILKLPLCWQELQELEIQMKTKIQTNTPHFFAKRNITLNIIADNFPCLIGGREAGI